MLDQRITGQLAMFENVDHELADVTQNEREFTGSTFSLQGKRQMNASPNGGPWRHQHGLRCASKRITSAFQSSTNLTKLTQPASIRSRPATAFHSWGDSRGHFWGHRFHAPNVLQQ